MQSAITEKLRELGAQFLKRSLGDVNTMRELMGHCRAQDTDAATQLGHLAHRMRGTGAVLGFTQLSEHVDGIEKLIERCVQGEDILFEEADRAALAEQVDRLETQIRQLMSGN